MHRSNQSGKMRRPILVILAVQMASTLAKPASDTFYEKLPPPPPPPTLAPLDFWDRPDFLPNNVVRVLDFLRTTENSDTIAATTLNPQDRLYDRVPATAGPPTFRNSPPVSPEDSFGPETEREDTNQPISAQSEPTPGNPDDTSQPLPAQSAPANENPDQFFKNLFSWMQNFIYWSTTAAVNSVLQNLPQLQREPAKEMGTNMEHQTTASSIEHTSTVSPPQDIESTSHPSEMDIRSYETEQENISEDMPEEPDNSGSGVKNTQEKNGHQDPEHKTEGSPDDEYVDASEPDGQQYLDDPSESTTTEQEETNGELDSEDKSESQPDDNPKTDDETLEDKPDSSTEKTEGNSENKLENLPVHAPTTEKNADKKNKTKEQKSERKKESDMLKTQKVTEPTPPLILKDKTLNESDNKQNDKGEDSMMEHEAQDIIKPFLKNIIDNKKIVNLLIFYPNTQDENGHNKKKIGSTTFTIDIRDPEIEKESVPAESPIKNKNSQEPVETENISEPTISTTPKENNDSPKTNTNDVPTEKINNEPNNVNNNSSTFGANPNIETSSDVGNLAELKTNKVTSTTVSSNESKKPVTMELPTKLDDIVKNATVVMESTGKEDEEKIETSTENKETAEENKIEKPSALKETTEETPELATNKPNNSTNESLNKMTEATLAVDKPADSAEKTNNESQENKTEKANAFKETTDDTLKSEPATNKPEITTIESNDNITKPTLVEDKPASLEKTNESQIMTNIDSSTTSNKEVVDSNDKKTELKMEVEVTKSD